MYTISTTTNADLMAEHMDKQSSIKVTNPIRWRPYDIYLHKVITVGISIGICARVLFSWGVL